MGSSSNLSGMTSNSFRLWCLNKRFFFPTKEGTLIKMTSYDKNGKVTGKSVTTIVAVTKSGTGTELTLRTESTDSKNGTASNEYTGLFAVNFFKMKA